MNLLKRLLLSSLVFLSLGVSAQAKIDDSTYASVLARHPQVGDVVFTRIGGPIFSRVAATTQSWTSHVGIIVDDTQGNLIVAESGIPVVRKTPLRRFLDRSEDGQFSIRRLTTPPNEYQKRVMLSAADRQLGTFYSLGFDLEGSGTFCSKFVHDIVFESTQMNLGRVETFDHLLHANPDAPLGFWKMWFFGSIPWERTTITPASELVSPLLKVVIDHNT